MQCKSLTVIYAQTFSFTRIDAKASCDLAVRQVTPEKKGILMLCDVLAPFPVCVFCQSTAQLLGNSWLAIQCIRLR